MAVNQEIAVPRVLVLANASFEDRRVRHCGNVLLQVALQSLNRRWRNYTHAHVRIKRAPVTVKRDLESAALDIRQRIRKIRVRAIQPDRHAGSAENVTAWRRSQKEYLLSRGKYAVAQQVRKQFRQPR